MYGPCINNATFASYTKVRSCLHHHYIHTDYNLNSQIGSYIFVIFVVAKNIIESPGTPGFNSMISTLRRYFSILPSFLMLAFSTKPRSLNIFHRLTKIFRHSVSKKNRDYMTWNEKSCFEFPSSIYEKRRQVFPPCEILYTDIPLHNQVKN